MPPLHVSHIRYRSVHKVEFLPVNYSHFMFAKIIRFRIWILTIVYGMILMTDYRWHDNTTYTYVAPSTYHLIVFFLRNHLIVIARFYIYIYQRCGFCSLRVREYLSARLGWFLFFHNIISTHCLLYFFLSKPCLKFVLMEKIIVVS